MTVSTPGGRPAAAARQANASAVSGRVLGGLQHRSVAAEEGRERLPGGVHNRRVRGNDQPRDTEQLPNRHRLSVRRRARRRLAVEAAPLPGNGVPELDRYSGLAARVLGAASEAVSVDVRGAEVGNDAQHLACCRSQLLESLVARCRALLPSNQVADECGDLCERHHSH